MEITLTSLDIILLLQIVTIVGFGFLTVLTFRAYRQLKSRLVLFIALAYLVIAISTLLRITWVPAVEAAGLEEAYLEAVIEAVQFLAAFLFFYGLKILKVKKAEATSA